MEAAKQQNAIAEGMERGDEANRHCAQNTLLMEAHQDEIPSKIHMEEDMWSDFTPVLRCTPMVMKEGRTHQTNCWHITLLKMDRNGPS